MPINHTHAAVTALLFTLLVSCGSPVKENLAPPIKEVSADQLRQWMNSGERFALIDVREDDEWRAGHAAAAVHVPRWALPDKIVAVAPDKAARIVLYCRGGVRSAAAAATLQKLGYLNVFSLAGGFQAYQQLGLPAS